MRRKVKKSCPNGKEKASKATASPTASSASAESDTEFEVEAIIEKRKKRGHVEYLVRWKGFSSKDDTWEASDQLNCPELISAFEENDQDEDEPLSIQANKKAKKRGRPKKATTVKNKRVKTVNEADGDDSDEKEYEVSKIVEVHHKKNGEREFLVRWKGYGKEDDTWEPEAHLSCNDLIETFMKKVVKAKEVTGRETRINRKATDRYVVQSPDQGRKLSGRTRGARRTYFEED